MEAWVRQFRVAARVLVQHPGMTAVAILALTLGIGLNTAMFSVLRSVFWRGLPLPESGRLVLLTHLKGVDQGKVTALPQEELAFLEAHQNSFSALTGYLVGTVNLTGQQFPHRFNGAFVTPAFLEVVGVQPWIGRSFQAEDLHPEAVPPVIIAHHVWREVFNADLRAVGRTVRVNGEPSEVIGVMPEDFRFPQNEEIWVLHRRHLPVAGSRSESFPLVVMGRMRDGVSLADCLRDLAALSAREGFPGPAGGEPHWGAILLNDRSGDGAAPWMWTLAAAVSAVLVIACANVANLLLVRTSARQRELAIRAALGASRWQIAQQILAESLILAAAGALGGLVLASWLVDFLWQGVATMNPPSWMRFRLDAGVYAFTVALAFATGLVAGFLPAWQATRVDLNLSLKDGGRPSTSASAGRFARLLTVLQIAVSSVLLVGAGLTLRTLVKLEEVQIGFDPSRLLSLRLGLFESDYPEAADRVRFLESLEANVRGLDGVQEAGLTSWISAHGSMSGAIVLEGEPEGGIESCFMETVSPGFFQTFGMRLLAGRLFGEEDGPEGDPVVVINRSLADRHGGPEAVLGRRIGLLVPRRDFVVMGEDGPLATGEAREWVRVIGVVADIKTSGIAREGRNATTYFPLRQSTDRFMSLIVRVRSGDPYGIGPAVSRQVLRLDPHLPVYFVRSMDDYFRQQSMSYRMLAASFLVFGTIAMFLSTLGVYGVMSFAVGLRRREIGIRMVLGAGHASIIDLILRQGMVHLAIGLALGLSLSYLATRSLTAFLFGISPHDPVTFFGVIGLLAAVALVSSLIPVRQAIRVRPWEVLRSE